jgi:hypothetical protein
MAIDTAHLQKFLNLSVALCGFSEFTLRGTGYAERYFSTVEDIVGSDTLSRLLEAFHKLTADAGADAERKDKLLRSRILSHEELGPIARNILKLWYVSTWFELPRSWRDKFGPLVNDRTFIPDPYAYPEGLLWPAVGSHVQGAKAPGYGTWAEAPQILEH